jgi:hypothetical protein
MLQLDLLGVVYMHVEVMAYTHLANTATQVIHPLCDPILLLLNLLCLATVNCVPFIIVLRFHKTQARESLQDLNEYTLQCRKVRVDGLLAICESGEGSGGDLLFHITDCSQREGDSHAFSAVT